MSISERFSTICGNYPAWYWIEFPRLQQSLKNVCEEDVRRRDFYLRQEMLCLSMGPILKAENWNPIGREERKWTFCMDNYVCLRDGGVERHLWWSDKSDGVIEPRLGGGEEVRWRESDPQRRWGQWRSRANIQASTDPTSSDFPFDRSFRLSVSVSFCAQSSIRLSILLSSCFFFFFNVQDTNAHGSFISLPQICIWGADCTVRAVLLP